MTDAEMAAAFVADFRERVAVAGPVVRVFRCTAEEVLAELDRQTREAASLRERLAEARTALTRATAALEEFEQESNRKELTAALIGGIRLFLEREA